MKSHMDLIAQDLITKHSDQRRFAAIFIPDNDDLFADVLQLARHLSEMKSRSNQIEICERNNETITSYRDFKARLKTNIQESWILIDIV